MIVYVSAVSFKVHATQKGYCGSVILGSKGSDG